MHTAPAHRRAAPDRLLVPRAPVLVPGAAGIHCLTSDGEFCTLDVAAARRLVAAEMPVACHAPRLAARLGVAPFAAYDVLELFAFVHPGRFCVPTPGGLARALSLLEPASGEDACVALRDILRHLLADLMSPAQEERSDPAAIAAMMGMTTGADGAQAGWPLAPAVLAALGRDGDPPGRAEIRAALRLWERLPEWAVHAPAARPAHHGVTPQEAQERLRRLLARQEREDRPQQRDYAAALSDAFAPRDRGGQTRVVLAEAGTGTGKTLGYLAPATVWAEKNGGAVWVSTYTRNLQKQVDAELEGLYADAAEKARRVVVRKGRENYLCLLNLEDAAQSPAIHTSERSAVALGLVLRWAAVTQDGDFAGRDFPGWLPGLVGHGRVAGLSDRRGECIYSACPHFNRCFVEKSARRARRADIVIANHALVMHQAAAAGQDDQLPQRYVFDEGHHLFEAADSAFSAALSGREGADLRRWILGAETGRKSRARGIRRRVEDLVAGDDAAMRHMQDIMEAARCLPAPLWRQRLQDSAPRGATEAFLALCRQQVLARNSNAASPYSLEAEVQPPVPGLAQAAAALSARLRGLQDPMLALAAALDRKLEDEADAHDSAARERIRFLSHSLARRARDVVGAWISMLAGLGSPPPAGVVDWLELARIDGREDDVGLHRHYVDPAAVFAARLRPFAEGVVMTSATLRDVSPEDAQGWDSARRRAGVAQLDETGAHTRTFSAPSPFDHAACTRILVVGDVARNRPDEVAAAFRALFLAAGGGALGVFTAVQRLRAVHARIAPALEAAGLPLYAQHADALDVATLVDIFRAEENACLLGTDATRDGIDVPGRSLRLVVYDRVPWPRPDILHKARRAHFGKGYDDMLARFRLKQAYGRLVRRETDRGVFVMLDSALPTRLLTAFPPGAEVLRVGLKEAIDITGGFLA